MDGFRIDPDALETPSTQIVAGVLDALCAGRLTTGDQLPSVRALAAHLGVNTNTVGRAYDSVTLGPDHGDHVPSTCTENCRL